jgi:hypothetical protein
MPGRSSKRKIRGKIVAASPRAAAAASTKAKGRFLSRDLALSIPIFRDLALVPDRNACYPESFSTREPKPASTSLSYDHTRCKSFPIAIRLQLPGLSFVADSRNGC